MIAQDSEVASPSAPLHERAGLGGGRVLGGRDGGGPLRGWGSPDHLQGGAPVDDLPLPERGTVPLFEVVKLLIVWISVH